MLAQIVNLDDRIHRSDTGALFLPPRSRKPFLEPSPPTTPCDHKPVRWDAIRPGGKDVYSPVAGPPELALRKQAS